MKLEEYVNHIKFELTGGILNIELNDEQLETVVKKSMFEIQRFINETRFVTLPFQKCISFKDKKVSSVVHVKRAQAINGMGAGLSDQDDPMYLQLIATTNGYNMYNLADWSLNYAAYTTLQQIQNTTSTDLDFIYNKQEEQLYINVISIPNTITVEYIPKFENVEEINSDYWIDVLYRLSLANTKKILGHIRSKYKAPSGGAWEINGDSLLEEGTTEYNDLIEKLIANSQISYGQD